MAFSLAHVKEKGLACETGMGYHFVLNVLFLKPMAPLFFHISLPCVRVGGRLPVITLKAKCKNFDKCM